MIKLTLCLLALASLTFADTTEATKKENCGCSEKSHSRASDLLGEKKLNFTVLGMKCGNCSANLTKKLKEVKEILTVDQVDHEKKSVQVTVKPEVCETVVKNAITKAGYFVKEEKK